MRRGEAGLCMTCGAEIPLPAGELAGLRLPGGPPNPAALERPARGARRGGGGRDRRWTAVDAGRRLAAIGGLVPARLRVSVAPACAIGRPAGGA